MKTVLTKTVTVMFLASSAMAQPAPSVTPIAFSQAQCPTQTEAYLIQEGTLFAEIPALDGAFEDDQAATEAYRRYQLSVHLLAAFTGQFLGLSTHPTKAYAAQSKALLDLTLCVQPSAQEQDLIVQKMKSGSSQAASLKDAEVRTQLFGAFDEFQCMGFVQASEAIFDLDPTAPDYPTKIGALMASKMKSCD